MKVVYCWDSGTIFTCQNLLLKSIVEKCVAPAMLSSASCICDSGYESFFVCMLSLWKSTQKHRVRSFFQTNTTTLHHRDWLGCITPASSMSLSEAHTSSRSGRGMHLNHSLKGSLSLVWISCTVALMQPSSFASSTKMSWKVKMSSLAAAAFLGFNYQGHPSLAS